MGTGPFSDGSEVMADRTCLEVVLGSDSDGFENRLMRKYGAIRTRPDYADADFQPGRRVRGNWQRERTRGVLQGH